MTFWDRIKSWLGGKEPSAPAPSAAKMATDPSIPTDLPTNIFPADMLNSISLSTDLTRIYFVDGGKLISFPLDGEAGVTIGLLSGQLAVVTPNKPKPTPIDPIGDEEDLSSGSPVAGQGGQKPRKKDGREVIAEIKNNSQYALAYNGETRTLSLIGALDIIITRDNPGTPPTDPSGNCALNLFDLDRSAVVIRRVKDRLVITEKEK